MSIEVFNQPSILTTEGNDMNTNIRPTRVLKSIGSNNLSHDVDYMGVAMCNSVKHNNSHQLIESTRHKHKKKKVIKLTNSRVKLPQSVNRNDIMFTNPNEELDVNLNLEAEKSMQNPTYFGLGGYFLVYRENNVTSLSINDTDFLLPKSIRRHNNSVMPQFDSPTHKRYFSLPNFYDFQ